jgi:hypothetical protein
MPELPHLSQVDLLEMVVRFGADALVGRVRSRMVCRHPRAGARPPGRLEAGRKDLAWVPVLER